jgi:hypothetical protein
MPSSKLAPQVVLIADGSIAGGRGLYEEISNRIVALSFHARRGNEWAFRQEKT